MFKKIVVGIFVLFWLVLAINPVNPGIWAMENIIVATVFPVVLWLDSKYHFNNWTFLVMTVFVILHLFGAHFTYEKINCLAWVSECVGSDRNYYDQFVHFLFGLMVFMPFYEIFYHQGYSRNLSYLLRDPRMACHDGFLSRTRLFAVHHPERCMGYTKGYGLCCRWCCYCPTATPIFDQGWQTEYGV
jgi:hypothetical protein